VQYLANYADLRSAFGTDEQAAAWHFIVSGVREGRTDDFMPPPQPRGRLILGTEQSETLVGTPGDDIIHGDLGQDTMTGGGADVFRFGSRLFEGSQALNADTHGDVIADFTQGQDKIDISPLCTDDAGVDRFTGIWIGTAPFSSVGPHPINADLSSGAPHDVPPEVRYEFRKLGDGRDVTVIQMDGPVAFESLKLGSTPLDARTDAEIVLVGRIELTAGDIIL
jgi:hypothetical protein